MTMLERVQNAIANAALREGVPMDLDAAEECARVAIAAMREGAGDLIANPPHPYFWPDGSNAPVVVNRLFDAALEEKPGREK